jgi:membrane protein DedA with SNARE-associated domain
VPPSVALVAETTSSSYFSPALGGEGRGERGRRKVLIAVVALLVMAAVAAAPRVVSALTSGERQVVERMGAELAVVGVYLEESGVPMPIPSEVSIGYLGKRVGAHPWTLVAAWIGLTALVVLGATNLFALSRRWGPRLVTGRIGTILHLTPDRLARAQRWFGRWGPLAIIASRYVPGIRWAMAVACGTLGVDYRMFWISSGISASIWVGCLLLLGVTAGDAVARVLVAHPWVVLLLPVPAVSVIASQFIRMAVTGRGGRPRKGARERRSAPSIAA